MDAVPWAILAVGLVVIIGLGVLGGPLGFFASAIAGGIVARVLAVCLNSRLTEKEGGSAGR